MEKKEVSFEKKLKFRREKKLNPVKF